jgi:chaperonin GroL
MQDKTAIGISDLLRQFIEALVEEVVIEGKLFDDQKKKYLQRYSEKEGVDYAMLEKNLTEFFEVAEECKSQKSKSGQIAMKALAKDCYLCDTKVIGLIENISDDKTQKETDVVPEYIDNEVKRMIADVMQIAKKNGVIAIEDSLRTYSYANKVKGMQFDRGYISRHFVTDTEKQNTVYKHPYILIYDEKIDNYKEFLPILEKIVQTNRPLLIISDDMEDEVLNTLVVNKTQGKLKVVAVRAPGFGDRKKEIMEDIAVLTGGTVISKNKGFTPESTTIEMLGTAEKIIVDKWDTTIIGGKGDEEAISNRIAQIKTQIEKSHSDYDREKLQERLAKLTDGVIVIYVSADSEGEMKQKKQRYEEALSSIHSAKLGKLLLQVYLL